MGASEEAIATEEAPPSMAEAWRMCWKVDTLRRIYRTLPFLAPALIGFVSLAAFLYNDVFGIDERGRGIIGAVTEPVQIVGLIVGARVGVKLFARDPKLVFRFLGWVSTGVAVAAAAFFLLMSWRFMPLIAPSSRPSAVPSADLTHRLRHGSWGSRGTCGGLPGVLIAGLDAWARV